MLVDVPRLITAYFAERPDPSVPAQRVVFGTSGHRGSAFDKAFNEWHILAITQAICLYRTQAKIDGPLFLGMDTHALSVPALASALEVLAANGVEVMKAPGNEYTPTPVISHAILTYNRGRAAGFADGIVITPSHNPPHDGGFKYNPPDGGPAQSAVTAWIEAKANVLLEKDLLAVKRIPFERALRAATTHQHDLARVVFYRKRSFTMAQFRRFMFAQSKPFPEMIALITQLKARYGLRVAAVSNEARELNAYRIRKFALGWLIDAFISSSFVHVRKPDVDIFRLALDITQTDARHVLYIENTRMFVQIAEGLGIRSILHTDYPSTCAKLTSFGLHHEAG